jgi:hypothetical protein
MIIFMITLSTLKISEITILCFFLNTQQGEI